MVVKYVSALLFVVNLHACRMPFLTGGKSVLSGDTSVDINRRPAEIYGSGGEIILQIGNGGAGPTGILRALSEDYLEASGRSGRISWIKNPSHHTLKILREGTIDIAITYEPGMERKAVSQGWASEHTRVFNDHFVVVGPIDNPAGLAKEESNADAFTRIANYGKKSGRQVFLSRDDGSATHNKESEFWKKAGYDPGEARPAWYRSFQAYPPGALLEADAKGLYTLTDRATFLTNYRSLKQSWVLLEGGKELLNPASALLQKNPSLIAMEFLAYLRSSRAQFLIASFGKDQFQGEALFTAASEEDFKRGLRPPCL